MTTTIKSSALDFNAIKNNLKVFFEQSGEYNDYDFEGSGLSNILDVLAYNTHLNGLTANFAVNESFLGTAQLRASLVSLSEAAGYIPASKTSSRGITNIYMDLSGVSNRPAQIFLPAYITFSGGVDGTSYTFQTLDALEAVDDGAGVYNFTTNTQGSTEIQLYEGYIRTKTFLVGGDNDNTVFVIPDVNMDIETAVVRVFDNTTTLAYDTYTDFKRAISITDNTKYYVLRESPNEYFDLTFGNGTSLGERPVAGNKIEVDYLSTSGPSANGATVFTATNNVVVGELGSFPLFTTTVNKSYAGQEKEDEESIRFNAPYVYASQNRMVTARDYAAVVLERFPNLISDIVAWGGEDNINPQFGVTFLSLLFNGDVTDAEKEVTKNDIRAVTEQLSVMSFGLEFADPQITYLEVGITFDFNTSFTSLPLNTVQAQVRNAVKDHFNVTVGSFGSSFRLSNMLTVVDGVSPAVLSSSSTVSMQQRITPILSSKNDIVIQYPASIITPDDVFYRVTSSSFIYGNRICIIRNKLNTNTIQVINIEDDEVLIDSIGNYNASSGRLNLVGFIPQAINGGVDYIKVSVTPANSNTIAPKNNDVIFYDEGSSFVSGTAAV
jgi:hypothetical protein